MWQPLTKSRRRQKAEAVARAYSLGAAIRLVVCLLLMAGLVWLLADEVGDHRARIRGQESGLGDCPPQRVDRFAVNTSFELVNDPLDLLHDLETINTMGVRAIRQRLSWAQIEPAPGEYDWSLCDALFPVTDKLGLDVIVVLDQSPAWARPEWEQDNLWAPPQDLANYVRFCSLVAQKYGGSIHAYQIWDSPNISPHWGVGPIDPAAYVEMLALASSAIRQADPGAVIALGALAPNTELGGLNLSDVAFLRECYRRGAGAYFDVVGVKALGFWSGPQDRRVDEGVLNLSRVILLREEMLRRGEGFKPIWAMDSGWCALPDDWQGKPNPAGSDTAFVQAERTILAYQRIQQEWPWMAIVCAPSIRPYAAADDPAWGYALLDAQGELTPIGERLGDYWRNGNVVYPGVYAAPEELWAPHPHMHRVDLTVWGTRLGIDVTGVPHDGELELAIADQPLLTLDLASDTIYNDTVTVARRLAPQTHEVAVYAYDQDLAQVSALAVSNHVDRTDIVLMALTVTLALMLLAETSARAASRIAWADLWYGARVAYHARLSMRAQALIVLAGGCLALWGPALVLRLAGLAFLALTAAANPDLSLLWTIGIIPFAPLQVRLGGLSFSIVEISVWMTFLGQAMNLVLSHAPIRRLASLWHDVCPLDWVVLALVGLGYVAAAWSEYRHVALREWRTVIVSAAMLYAVIRIAAPERRLRQRMIHAAVTGGALTAVYALLSYWLPSGVIEAEGVRRARAFYGSPNNLALVLERYLPLALAMALPAGSRRHRLIYGAGTAAVVVALGLTFSRAALLIALPVGLVLVLFARKGRSRWVFVVMIALVVALVILMAGTERFSSLLDTSQGTTALRLSLWRSSWRMALDHPWLGVGPDNFLYYYGDYILPGGLAEPNLSHPHNVLLDFWLRLGAGGLALLLAILIGFGEAWRQARKCALDADQRAALTGLMAATAAGLAHGLVDAWFFVMELALFFMMSLGWIVASSRATRDAADEVGPAA